MKKLIKYSKIHQFRNVIANINRTATFVKLDNSGKAIYNNNNIKPVITFQGTVKLHGTNSSVCYNKKDGFWIQSRRNIITLENDNAGFAFFAESNKKVFMLFFEKTALKYNIDLNQYTITIYGEWAGKGIQKGVGIAQLEKAFYIFGIKVSNLKDDSFTSYWIESQNLKSPENRIFNVNDYKTYSIEIDFNNPQLVQNKLAKITEEVEKECPVAKAHGIDNSLGEGVVWKGVYKDSIYIFKVKGEKHSATKVKILANIDTEKIKTIQQFVDYAVTKNRFNQAIENIFPDKILDIKKLGELIKWTVKDILSEEIDTIKENNLEPKDITKQITQKVKKMFFEIYI